MTTTQTTEPSLPQKSPEPPAAPPPAPRPPNPIRDMVEAFKAVKDAGSYFWACNIIFLLDGAAYFGILNILTLFLNDQAKLDDKQAGWFVSLLTGLVTLIATFLGGVADKLGVRRTLLITIVASLAGRTLLVLSPSLPAMTVFIGVAMAMMAFGAGLLQTAVYTGVKQATNETNRAVGFSLLYALMNGGIVLESMVSSSVRKAYETTGVLWMCVGITAAYLVVQLVVFPRSAGAPVKSEPAKSPTAAVVTTSKTMAQRVLEHPLANPRFLFFIFILLGVRTLFAHQWLTMPSYVTRAYPTEVGERFEWINALNPFIILFGAPIVAALTSRVDVVKMMILGTLVSAVATFLLVPGPNLTALLAYVIIFSIGEALWSSRFYEYVATIAPPNRVGVYMGVATIPWFMAKTTTGLYSGWMLQQFCPEGGPFNTGTMWLIYGIVGMTSPVGLVLAYRWLRRGNMATSAA